MNNFIYGMEKVSLVDYDNKVSCVLFLKGCNFRCRFCHNASLVDCFNKIKPLNYDDVIDYLEKRKNILDSVVVTGGEPTLSKQLLFLLKDLKRLGYLVKLDTNGTNPLMLKEAIDNSLVDFVAMDIKNTLDKYNDITNVLVNIDKIYESINIIIKSSIDYEFRTTLVKEYHSKEDIIKLCEMMKNAKKYVLQKYVYRDTCLDGLVLHSYSDEEISKLYKDLSLVYHNLVIRGYSIWRLI